LEGLVPFCLKPARPIAVDLRRIVDRQLALAIPGRRLFAEKARRVVRPVNRPWHATPPVRHGTAKKGPWRRAA
jgi:hypothetical protein